MAWKIALPLSIAAALATGVLMVTATAQEVKERQLLDNDRVLVVEYTFPPGFRGEEHAAVANELAYVLEGEFAVITRGQGKRVVRRGEVEYASKGTLHSSRNETRKPARVLVVILKEP